MKDKPLRWKIYDALGQLRGATCYPEDAAMVVSGLSAGATVEYDRPHGSPLVVWREGHENGRAGESFDRASMTMFRRMEMGVESTG